MGYQTIRYEVKDGVATITLNRPESYNALNLALGSDLFHATLEADEDRAVRCIVVTGAGKAFCAGGDVKDFNDKADRIGVVIKELTTYLHGAVSRLARSAKPVIRAVNGVAAGGGMSHAIDGHDHGLGRSRETRDRAMEIRRQLLDHHPDAIGIIVEVLDVAARAESLPRPRNHDAAHGAVLVGQIGRAH